MDFVDEFYADKDLSLLKKLTLVIPTYNRNFYLSRCLWYHAHFPFGEIIVADSSPEEKKAVNRETVAKVRAMFDANIRYLEYEPETEKYGGDIHRKWGDAVQHVETAYSQICTDKEFLVPVTVCESIDYLEQNSDYAIAEGGDCLITCKNGTPNFFPWQATTSMPQSDSFLRLISFILIETGRGIQFSVHRSHIHKEIYSNLKKYQLNDLRFGEAAIELQPVILGKSKRFPAMVANCRDTIYLEKKFLLFGVVDKHESSYLRYPPLSDYSSQMYHQGLYNLKKCCMDLLVPTSCETDAVIEGTLNQILPMLIRQRYDVQDPILRVPFFRKIWDFAPVTFKEIIRDKLGKTGQPIGITSEMEIIVGIISAFQKNYKDDTSVVDVACG
jgi:glycosyltransferase domain-containing protein